MRLVDADAFRRELDNHWPFTKEEQSKHGIADLAKGTVLMVLGQMPTIEPEQHWIPVSEKLPKNRTMVLVTCADEFHRWVDDDEFIDGKFWYCDKNVVAWCEYPEPWEGEQS